LSELLPLLEACLTLETKGFAQGSDVLELTLSNRSDAKFQLRSLSNQTFTGDHDLIEVAPHSSIELRLRTPRIAGNIRLEFEVLNALTAPDVHPRMQFTATVSPDPA